MSVPFFAAGKLEVRVDAVAETATNGSTGRPGLGGGAGILPRRARRPRPEALWRCQTPPARRRQSRRSDASPGALRLAQVGDLGVTGPGRPVLPVQPDVLQAAPLCLRGEEVAEDQGADR